MLRFKGNITEVQLIENYIIANTTFENDNGGEDYSKAFIKQYDIYLQTEGNSDLALLLNLIPSATIKFWYDYRNYIAEMKISEYGLNLLCNEYPKLKRMIKGLKEYDEHLSILSTTSRSQKRIQSMG